MEHEGQGRKQRRISGFWSDVTWGARKLRSQDGSYLFRRLSYALRKAVVDRTFTRFWQGRGEPWVDGMDEEAPALEKHFRERSHPKWFFNGEDEELVAEIPEATKVRTLAEAGEILDRRFALIGHGDVVLAPIDWNYASSGNLELTRELNRHASFERLGFAYRYSGDETFARSFVELSEAWIDQCSGNIGRLPWDTPFQVGRRINAWIWAFHLFLPSTVWREAAKRRFLLTLGLLTEYLYHVIEYHSPGNHILSEAKTLAFCGEVFPEFAAAQRWRRKGWRTLEQEVARQVCADGVHAERSTMYHRIIAGELAELWVFCRLNSLPQAEDLEEVVRKMADFQRSIDLGDGCYPLFGDSRSVDSYYRFNASALVDLLDLGTAGRVEGSTDDHTWWASSRARDGGEERTELSREAKANSLSRSFVDGGYYVTRCPSPGGESVLVWDCGPFGYAANRKHAHADALSFVLAVGGEPLLVDLGLGERHIPNPQLASRSRIVGRRAGLRKTRAHNTLTVNEEDQAILANRSEIWDPPMPKVVVWGQSPELDVMWGRHDGYLRLTDPVIHERVIVANRAGYWLVVDHLAGSGLFTTDLWYHVAAGAGLVTLDDGSFRISKGDSELRLVLFGRKDVGPKINTSIEEKLGELRDGSPDRHAVIRGTIRVEVPLEVGTLMFLPGVDARARFLEQTDSAYEVEVRTRDGSDLISVWKGEDHGSATSLDGDRGRVVCRRLNRKGEVLGEWSFDQWSRADRSQGQTAPTRWGAAKR